MMAKRLFRSVLRLIPAFALFSVLGCIIGHFIFSIPHGELAVVVSVPLVVAFILTRFLVLVVPRETPTDATRPSLPKLIMAALVFLCFAVAVVMLPSSAIYDSIGLNEIAKGALTGAVYSFGAAVILFILDVAAAIAAALPLNEMIDSLVVNAVGLFWEALRSPTEISIRLLGDYGNPISNAR